MKLLQTVQDKLKICEARSQDNEKELKRTADEVVIMKKKIQSKDNEMNTMKQKITTLEQERSSRDDDEDEDGFKWNLQNYNHYKEIGEAYSSKFFMAGRCCMLGLDWFGNKKGRLGIFFYLCDGVRCRGNRYFNNDVHLEIRGKGGAYHHHVIDSSEIEMNLDYCREPSTDNMVGNYHFLNMPNLQNFIVNDCLNISCKLV